MEDGGGLKNIDMAEIKVEEFKKTICDTINSIVKCCWRNLLLIFISTLLCKVT